MSKAIPVPGSLGTQATPDKVKFTRQQAEYLNRTFSEVIGDQNTTEAQLRISQGQRRVVQHVRGLVDGGVQ